MVHAMDLDADGHDAAAVADHGGLTGLVPDDDHTQYALTTEGGQPRVQAHGDLGAAETIDPSNGNIHSGTLDQDCDITLGSIPTSRGGNPAGGLIALWLTVGTGGGHTPTFDAGAGTVTWDGGVEPTWPTDAGVTYRVLFETLSGDDWIGVIVGGSGSLDADGVRDAGRWEHVTEPGSSAPPVDVYSPDGTEWVYAWVTD